MATLDFSQFRAEDGSNTKRRIQGIYTGPASYAAAGDPFTAAEAKLGQIDHINFGIAINAANTATRLLIYDVTNAIVRWYVPDTGAEVAGTTDLSTFTARFEAIGR